VRTRKFITSEFPITIDLTHRLALSPYLFALVMDELIKLIKRKIPCYIFFCRWYHDCFSRWNYKWS